MALVETVHYGEFPIFLVEQRQRRFPLFGWTVTASGVGCERRARMWQPG
jgi:hypothetical protein